MTPDVGGGFGHKGCVLPAEGAIAALAIRLGRPVQGVEERWANQRALPGRGHTVAVEAAVQHEGTLVGLRVPMVADRGASFLLSTPTVPVSTRHRLTRPSTTPARRSAGPGVVTKKPPTGADRGAGGPEAAGGMERPLDLLARDLHLAPAAVRRTNLIPPAAFPYRTPTGIPDAAGR